MAQEVGLIVLVAGVKVVVASVSLCRFATKVLFGGPFPLAMFAN